MGLLLQLPPLLLLLPLPQLLLPLPLLSTRLGIRCTTRSTLSPRSLSRSMSPPTPSTMPQLLVPMLASMDSPWLLLLPLLLLLRKLLRSKMLSLGRKELAKYFIIDQWKHQEEENEFANCYFHISIAFSIIYYCFLLRCITTVFSCEI